MRYLITMSLDDDDERVNPTSDAGLNLDGYERLIMALIAQGFEDVEISGDGS